jgi:hypothetical protein
MALEDISIKTQNNNKIKVSFKKMQRTEMIFSNSYAQNL